jgi:hypothetical protein
MNCAMAVVTCPKYPFCGRVPGLEVPPDARGRAAATAKFFRQGCLVAVAKSMMITGPGALQRRMRRVR